jgi:hypothetical protein
MQSLTPDYQEFTRQLTEAQTALKGELMQALEGKV